MFSCVTGLLGVDSGGVDSSNKNFRAQLFIVRNNCCVKSNLLITRQTTFVDLPIDVTVVHVRFVRRFPTVHHNHAPTRNVLAEKRSQRAQLCGHMNTSDANFTKCPFALPIDSL